MRYFNTLVIALKILAGTDEGGYLTGNSCTEPTLTRNRFSSGLIFIRNKTSSTSSSFSLTIASPLSTSPHKVQLQEEEKRTFYLSRRF